MRKKAQFGHFLLCMLILICSTAWYYSWDLENAKSEYITENNLPSVRHPKDDTWLFGHDEYYTQPDLSYDEIGDKFIKVLLHTFLFLLLYPLLGRLLVLLAQGLTALFDTIAKDLNFHIDNEPIKLDNWSPELILYGAVLGPLTLIAIGLLIIANLLMFIYKFFI